MGKIDMSKVGKATENKELKDVKPIEAPIEPAELTDSASNASEDTHETKQEAKAESKGTAVVKYVGSGVWKDSVGALWAHENMTEDILTERQYPIEEYETRDDLKFMVNYGEMQVSIVRK